MCEAADLFPKNPLYKCDFDGNLAAGNKLNDGLMMGMSEDWRVTLKAWDPLTALSLYVRSILSLGIWGPTVWNQIKRIGSICGSLIKAMTGEEDNNAQVIYYRYILTGKIWKLDEFSF